MIQDGDTPGVFASIVLGIVEGLTEFLPVSSTGHLIVANAALGGSDPTYEIAIQAGAISAIAFLYRKKLWDAARNVLAGRGRPGETNLFFLLVVAALPAAILGVLFDDVIEELLFSPTTVATTLLLGGVAMLAVEAHLDRRSARSAQPLDQGTELSGMSLGQAFGVGCFQVLALIPGTSRSGATIIGGLLLGFRRTSAAEFSFLVGLPVLYGACLLKSVQDWERVSGPLAGDLAIGCVVSFLCAAAIIGPFVRYLQRHSFRVFAWYRIAAGVALFGLIFGGVL